MRTYEVGIVVEGPGVSHPVHPTLLLTGDNKDSLEIAGSYDDLVNFARTIINKVVERQEQD